MYDLTQFVREHPDNIVDKFRHNCRIRGTDPNTHSSRSLRQFVREAFVWAGTSEGDEFWESVSIGGQKKSQYNLARFRKEHGDELADKFIRAFNSAARHGDGYFPPGIAVDEYTKKTLYDFINQAFSWDNTSDGYDYWRKISQGKRKIVDPASTKAAPTDKCYCSARAKLYGGCSYCGGK